MSLYRFAKRYFAPAAAGSAALSMNDYYDDYMETGDPLIGWGKPRNTMKGQSPYFPYFPPRMIESLNRFGKTESGTQTTVKSTKGNCNLSGSVKAVTFNHKSRKPLSGSRYDKVNCCNGTFSTVSASGMSTAAGTQLWKVIHFEDTGSRKSGSDGGFFQLIQDKMQQKLFAAGGTATPQMMTGSDPVGTFASKKTSEIVWQKIEYQFVNQNTHHVTLVLYDMVLKKSIDDINSQDPLQLMAASADFEGNYAVGTNLDITSINDPSYKMSGDKLRTYWRVANKVTAYLRPGEQIKYTSFHRMHFNYDYVLERIGDTTPTFPNVTKVLVANAYGEVVSQQLGGAVTKDGAKIDYVVTSRTFVRERLPFQERFHIKASATDLPSFALSAGQCVEEDSPGFVLGN